MPSAHLSCHPTLRLVTASVTLPLVVLMWIHRLLCEETVNLFTCVRARKLEQRRRDLDTYIPRQDMGYTYGQYQASWEEWNEKWE